MEGSRSGLAARNSVKNVLEYCEWATVHDLDFRVRFALRDPETYQTAHSGRKQFQGRLFNFDAPDEWCGVGSCLWYSLCPRPGDGLQHPLRVEITGAYKEWVKRGKPHPLGKKGTEAFIDSQLGSDSFWGERARWGDDVGGLFAALWVLQTGQGRKGAKSWEMPSKGSSKASPDAIS